MSFSNGPTVVTNGLVLSLDAGDRNSYVSGSTTWFDLSGTNNNNTLTNGPTFSSANGGSILYDGINDYVSAPNNSTLQIIGQITLGSWFKLSSSATGEPTIIQKENYISATNNAGYLLRSNRTANNVKIIILNDAGYPAETPSGSINPNTWYYACGTYDGSQIKIYLNGELSGTTNYSGPIKSNSQPLFIGQNGSGFRMNGNIATTQIYNRALSASEVLQNYNALKGRFGL